jgi:anhydro-N-acetylmuramic acid kinase
MPRQPRGAVGLEVGGRVPVQRVYPPPETFGIEKHMPQHPSPTDVNHRLIAGAMSGTSADGVDVAIVRIAGRGRWMSAELVGHHAATFDPDLRRQIFAARSAGAISLGELARLTRDISLAYAQAVLTALSATGTAAHELTAVAAHGQTMFHDPPLTMQIFDPSLVAARVGRPVVSDFRRADCAAGGQGAPLVPFADYVLYRSDTIDRVLLNIGGIANLTYLRAGGSPDDVIAFDTGPGNCLSDHVCRTRDPRGPGYDAGGRLASRGTANQDVIEAFLADAYFRQPPPKSTDVPALLATFDRLAGDLSVTDALATACAITARTIVDAFDRFVGDRRAVEWVVSGGGAENATIMALLGQSLPRLRRVEHLGVSAAAKEAVAFALLGAATLDGEPSNLPSVTGASRAVVLGSITPRP